MHRHVLLGVPLLVTAAFLLTAVACDDDPPDVGSTLVEDAGETGAEDGGTSDVTTLPDVGARTPSACEGECRITSIQVDIGGVVRPLERAQFGTEVDDAGVTFFYAEAHFGGAPECPEENSPSPKRTLIMANLPRGVTSASYADGVRSSFLDFAREQITSGKPAAATEIAITNILVDTASPPAWIAYDITETLVGGSVKGHVFAEYCASMSL